MFRVLLDVGKWRRVLFGVVVWVEGRRDFGNREF